MHSIAWLCSPHEYEPDWSSYWADLLSLEENMADVAEYGDWFPDQTQDGGEFWSRFHLLKHLAEHMTEKNWRDKRLYILRHLDRIACNS